MKKVKARSTAIQRVDTFLCASRCACSATFVRFRALPVGGSLSVSIDRIVRHIYLFRTHPTMFFFHYPSRARAPLLFRSISVIIISANVTRFQIIDEFLLTISHANQSMLNFKPRSATRRRNRLIIIKQRINISEEWELCADSSLAARLFFSFAILIITKHKRYLDVIYICIFNYFLIFIN